MLQVLEKDQEIRTIAQELTTARDVLYLGRGTSYAVALEGALKLKEISYIHAEAYAAGELKHGPIALIDESVPVIVVAPRDHLFEKTASNLQEVVARGGRVVLLSDADGVANSATMPGARWSCPRWTRSWRRSFTPYRSSSSPIIRPCSRARTSTSRATSPRASRSSSGHLTRAAKGAKFEQLFKN